MAGEWRETTLGEFVRLQRGHDLTEADRRPGLVPVMGSAGRNGFHDTAKATGPGVVIGRSGVGSMGVVTYCPTDYWPHNTVLYVTDFLGNDERFTYYFLRHLNLRRFDSGSAQASLNRNYIYPIRIRVPQPAEQRAIAHVLGTLDDKIELDRRLDETLEAIALAVFKSWFVDFDPVRAKAEGREFFLPKALANLFPDAFEDSEQGEIPQEWRVARLGDPDLFPLVPPGVSADATANLHYIATGDVQRDRILGDTEGVKASLPSRANMEPGDGRIWFAKMKDSPKYIWTMSEDQEWWSHRVLSTGFSGLQAKSKYESLLYCFIAGADFDRAKNNLATGTTMQALNNENIRRIALVVPPQSVAARFDMFARPFFRRRWLNALEARTLAKLRDTLVPQLISGDLRIEDTDHFGQRGD
jgi:type I restriction enzyme S subunit